MSTGEAMTGLSTEELRAAVRAVLRDLLPSLDAARTTSPVNDSMAQEQITLRTDADLDAFVRRLAALCADPARRAALHEGRHGFRLAVDGALSAAPSGGAVVRIDRGAVTERIVSQAAADGAGIVLGRGAVLTPLARDKARSLGVVIATDKKES